MLISRQLRRLVARLLVGLLIYAQLAIAAYACSTAVPHGGNSSAGMMAAGEMVHEREWAGSASEPAWQMDLDQPGLCAGHCQSGQQNIDVKPTPSPSLALIAGYFTLETGAQRAVFGRAASPAESPPPKADPPHAILHCCYRI